MTQDRKGVSRRDLIGKLLRKPVDEIQERLPEALKRAGGASRGRAAPTPQFTYPKRRRPDDHSVLAVPDAAGRYLVDLNAHPLRDGMSWRVVADDLAEALILVRVSETHVAAATGECPLDGSDLFWQRAQELLWCPGCGSQWRLDGTISRGPARRRLLSLHVDEAEGIARIDVP